MCQIVGIYKSWNGSGYGVKSTGCPKPCANVTELAVYLHQCRLDKVGIDTKSFDCNSLTRN